MFFFVATFQESHDMGGLISVKLQSLHLCHWQRSWLLLILLLFIWLKSNSWQKIRHAWFMIYNFGQVAKNTPTWRVFPTWVLVPKCVFFSLIVVLPSYSFQAVVHLFKVAESSAKSKNIPKWALIWGNGGGFPGLCSRLCYNCHLWWHLYPAKDNYENR